MLLNTIFLSVWARNKKSRRISAGFLKPLSYLNSSQTGGNVPIKPTKSNAIAIEEMRDGPGDEEDDDRQGRLSGQAADTLVPCQALCKSGLIIDFKDQGDQTHCSAANSTGEQSSRYWTIDFLGLVQFFSQSCHD
jgi:hypothetical protein